MILKFTEKNRENASDQPTDYVTCRVALHATKKMNWKEKKLRREAAKMQFNHFHILSATYFKSTFDKFMLIFVCAWNSASFCHETGDIFDNLLIDLLQFIETKTSFF